MFKNNKKSVIGKNFLFCLCIICLMFTTFGLTVGHSCAADLNDTVQDIRSESDDVVKLENSHDMEVLGDVAQDIVGKELKPQKTFANIKSAVDNADPGDTILLSGEYTAQGDDRIIINKKLTIKGDGTAVLNGKNLCTAFSLHENAKGTVINNIKFINCKGNQGSVIYVIAQDVKITNCIFQDNHANNGGAVNSVANLDETMGLIIDNCQFIRNTNYHDNFESFSSGAGVSIYGKNSKVTNCIFEDNWVKGKQACYGGAIQAGLDVPGSNIVVSGCVFKNNQAISINEDSHGGAGCVRQGTSYIDCLFINNVADEGGALTFHSSGTIKNCTFIDNKANMYGGAVSSGFLYETMKLNVVDCNFEGNTALNGGAMWANGLNIIIDNTNFKNNHVTDNGGAIYVTAQDVTIKSSIFDSNNANVDGGAVYIKGTNTVVKDSTFLSNNAIPDVNKLNDGLGGAIYVAGSLVDINNNVFRYNTARNGSAVYYDKYGDKLTLNNNEFLQNQAWVYHLPIYSQNIYYTESEQVKVVLYGGNNIAAYNNLSLSNAIYNAADYSKITFENQYPLFSATNSGEIYQDDREYNINVLLTIQHEDGTLVYNEVCYTDYLGQIVVDLDNLKAGKYYVSAKHYEDNYYKGITNVTTFMVAPQVDNSINKSVSKTELNYEDVVTWTITIKNDGPSESTNVTVCDVIPAGLEWINDTANGRYNHDSGVLTLDHLGVNESFTFNITTVVKATGNIVNKVNVTSDEFDFNLNNNYDEELIFVYPAADLAVVKKVSDSQPNYKENITWTIEITNNGPDIAHNVVMLDILPDSLVYISSDGEYNNETGIWEIESIDVGKTVKINIKCWINKTGLFENFVSVNATEFDYDVTNNNDSERIYVRPASDLSVEKTVNASKVNYNDLVKWTLTVVNNGPDIAANVRIVDILPDGFTYVNSTLTNGYFDGDIFRIDKFDVGERVIIDIITLVESTGNFTNWVNITSDSYDYDLTNNEDEEDIFVYPASDISVTKTVSEENPYFNDNVTWTIEIINYGPDVAHNITAYDLLPDSLIWINDDGSGDYDHVTGLLFIEELGIGESYTLNIECKVNRTGLIQNNVTVTVAEYDYNKTNNFDNETIDVEKSADVSIVKLVNNSSPYYNDLVKWTLIISNKGPDKATNITVEDALPQGLIFINCTGTRGFYEDGVWTMCCLENGEVETLEIICRVNKTGELVNIAAIHADEYDYDLDNNEDNETIDVPLAVDLEVSIKADNAYPLFGETVNWMISVRNNGPDNATGVVLHDMMPDGLNLTDYGLQKGLFNNNSWYIGSLNVGDMVNMNITTVSNAIGSIINEVDVNSTEYDWFKSNNYDSDEIDVVPIADLSVVKLVNNDAPNYLEKVKWTLIVSNNGPNVAHNIVVEDVLPKGLEYLGSTGLFSNNVWNIASLGVGESKTLEIVCRVLKTGKIYNVAHVHGDELDLNESNNHAVKSITVPPASDLSVTKTASKSKYTVGDVITYTIKVANSGPDTARNVKVREILGKGLKIVSVKTTKGSYDAKINMWSIDKLAKGESEELVIKAVALKDGIVENTVTVTSDNFDYDLTNNEDSVVVNVDENDVPESLNVPERTLSNLELHPTAIPFNILIVLLSCAAVALSGNFSKRR